MPSIPLVTVLPVRIDFDDYGQIEYVTFAVSPTVLRWILDHLAVNVVRVVEIPQAEDLVVIPASTMWELADVAGNTEPATPESRAVAREFDAIGSKFSDR